MIRFILSLTLAQLGLGKVPLLPPPPVLTPAEQLATFRFAEPGYRIELVASDPMIQDPVAMAFDGQGRLWVVEMRGYMQDIDRRGVNDPIGRISVLEDKNQDGKMDHATVFLDKLVLPRSINIQPDGVLIAERTKLWFARDLDGDLVCDDKTLVDKNYARDNIEHSANGLYRALDNWLYNAKEGHRYRRQGAQWLRQETEERGQWGISQNDLGQLYYNYNHSQLHTDLAPPNSLTRNPHHTPSTGLSAGVVSSNTVHPIRPTTAANRGYIPGALDEEGRITQFTSACAPLIYRSKLMPDLHGNAFVCATVGNLIKRNRLTQNGLSLTGEPAYPDRDFLASTDERFRPVFLADGPDGALYITDMYRGIVQDGPHMSPYLREHIITRKMDRPVHLGRIWRIVPESPDTQSAVLDFASMTTSQLVDTLSHQSGWWRDMAQLHLVENDHQDAIPSLQKLLSSHQNPITRLHALWTLEGLRTPHHSQIFSALSDSSPYVQAAALRVLVSLKAKPNKVSAAIEQLISPPLPDEVALQAILTLGDLAIPDEERISLIQKLLLPRAHDPLFRDAALSSLKDRESPFLDSLWSTLPAESKPAGMDFFLEILALAITRSHDSDTIAALLTRLPSNDSDWRKQAILKGLTILGPSLSREPIALSKKPEAVAHHPHLKEFFTWPGHQPTPSTKTGPRALSKKEAARFAQGRQIYLASCAACHGPDGKGTKLIAPPLADSDWVEGSHDRLGRVLLHGLSGPITVSGKHYTAPEVQPVMPPLASLGNIEMAAVLTYIRRSWGNTADPVTPGHISKLRIASQGRTVPWTEKELQIFVRNPPNILYIVADDLGFSDLGCYGGEIATPHLDALAQGGLRLTQFYNTGRCCPSRASLLTGQYPHAVGLGHMTKDINRPGYRGRVSPDAKTIAQQLQPLGYRSFLSGKWHLGTDDPTQHGFEQFYGTLVSAKRFFDPDHLIRKPDGAKTILYPEGQFYATDAVTDHALAFLDEARTTPGQPWFLYLSYHAPHFPLHAPAEDIAQYADRYHGGWDALRRERLARMKKLGIVPQDTQLTPRSSYWNYGETETGTNPAWDTLPKDRRLDLARRMAIYAAMVDRMDRQIGRVIADLRKRDELDNTLIIFLSDNGACAEWDPRGFDGKSSNHNKLHTGAELDSMGGPGTFHSAGSGWANASNTPWRLYKHFNHEGGINSPCIIHWPAGLAAEPGSIIHQPAHLIDLLPTALAASGKSDPQLPGLDLISRFSKHEPSPRVLFFEHEGNRAVRTSKWKLVALRGKPWELYDFRKTRTEMENLAERHPEVVKHWAKRWDKWAKENHVTPLPDDYGVKYLRKKDL